MFREIRNSERITEEDRRRRELQDRLHERRISEASREEYEASKQYWNNIFNSIDVSKRL